MPAVLVALATLLATGSGTRTSGHLTTTRTCRIWNAGQMEQFSRPFIGNRPVKSMKIRIYWLTLVNASLIVLPVRCGEILYGDCSKGLGIILPLFIGHDAIGNRHISLFFLLAIPDMTAAGDFHRGVLTPFRSRYRSVSFLHRLGVQWPLGR